MCTNIIYIRFLIVLGKVVVSYEIHSFSVVWYALIESLCFVKQHFIQKSNLALTIPPSHCSRLQLWVGALLLLATQSPTRSPRLHIQLPAPLASHQTRRCSIDYLYNRKIDWNNNRFSY